MPYEKEMIRFDATNLIIISYKLIEVVCNFTVREPTQEEYENQNFIMIELKTEVPPWDPSSSVFN